MTDYYDYYLANVNVAFYSKAWVMSHYIVFVSHIKLFQTGGVNFNGL